MDLFLVNSPHHKNISPWTVGYAGLALLGVYILTKMFTDKDEDNQMEQLQDQDGHKPAGIYNQGNTCFVNSLLQALSSLQSFQQILKNTASNFRGSLTPHQQLIIQLSSVLSEINNANESISVGKLLATIQDIKEGLINLEQQDAHELYTSIISCMDETLNSQKKLDLSASVKDQEDQQQFENPLIGYLKSSTICTTCKCETSMKIDPFYDISLDISKMYVHDIRTALLEFQREQRIDCWICSNCSINKHCQKLKKAIKLLKGSNKDKLSIIATSIIDFLSNTNLQENEIKEVNMKLQDFGKTFIEQYRSMEGDPEREIIFVEMEGQETSILKRTVITKYPNILVMHFKQLVVNPYSGDVVLLKKNIAFDEILTITTKTQPRNYKVTGLLTHIGTQSFGHYLSFRRKNKESDQWFMMNDSSSQKTSFEVVQQSRPYMLFYEAI